jgi:hypothetical protein
MSPSAITKSRHPTYTDSSSKNNQTPAPKKVPGHDNVRNIDVSNLPLNAVTHLEKIINVAFRFHYIPKTWKEANVTPKRKSPFHRTGGQSAY